MFTKCANALNSNVTSITSTINSLATVAHSGSYNDLSNKPTIPSDFGFNFTSKNIAGTTDAGGYLSTGLNLANHVPLVASISSGRTGIFAYIGSVWYVRIVNKDNLTLVINTYITGNIAYLQKK